MTKKIVFTGFRVIYVHIKNQGGSTDDTKLQYQRKPFVKALEEITGAKAIYKTTPTYAYEVGCYTVTREGNLEYADGTDIAAVTHELTVRGFVAESQEIIAEELTTPQSEELGQTVAIAKDKVNTENLDNLLLSKGFLVQKALGADNLEYEEGAYEVRFPWFSEIDPDATMTYSKFDSAICEMTIIQKRISPSEKKATNEKYAFRCFLLRLDSSVMNTKQTERFCFQSWKAHRHSRVEGNRNIPTSVIT